MEPGSGVLGDAAMKHILVTTSSFGVYDRRPLAKLEKAGLMPVMNPHGRKLTIDETVAMIKEHQPVGIVAGTEKYPAEMLQAASPFLKVISRVGVGWDSVDLNAAEACGIRVLRTPDSHVSAVAELTIGLMLTLLRRIVEADRLVRRGSWKPLMGNLLGEKAVGLVGYGNVGRRLARMLVDGFGASVIWFDPYVPAQSGQYPGKRADKLETLLKDADVVTLHVPGGPAMRHLIGEGELRLMKPNSVIINTARGGLIDEAALKKALDAKLIAGAGLDVFEEEPYAGPLKSLESVVMTMHMGSYAQEARTRMELEAVDNLLGELIGVSK